MGMVVQHNLSALNANNRLNTNVAGLKKASEKLSSGYRINRAGDDAAGLAISEKMRSQIRGLDQAERNAQDGISLIQTAEGGLNETHSILQRMRELSVQSANGTYKDDTDREAIQLEVDALKEEIDRISSATEYNNIKLLDGSLSGTGSATNSYGATYGVVAAGATNNLAGAVLTSNIAGATVTVAAGASGKGGENATWSKDGKTLTMNLVAGETYTQSQVDDIIKNATQDKTATGAPASISLTLNNGIYTAKAADTTGASVAGLRATSAATDLKALVGGTAADSGVGSSDTIKFTANTYGTTVQTNMASKITIVTDAEATKENVTVGTAATATDGAEIVLHLSTGVEYTEDDIAKVLKKAGYDYSVSLTDGVNPDGNVDGKIKFNVADAAGIDVDMTEGAGVGKDKISSTGEGLVFQIGANGTEDQEVTLNVGDMSSSGIGVASINVATRDGAKAAIDSIDKAVKTVSLQRSGLGALQNRLEYTTNNLTTTSENLTNAESQIRDTDMAKEMLNYTKFNVLQQAAQSMLAQANQQPQSILQLLG